MGDKAVLKNKLEVEAHREISGLDYDYLNPGVMRDENGIPCSL